MKTGLRELRVPAFGGVVILLAISGVLFMVQSGTGQQPKAEGKKPTLTYYGVSACTQCHDKPDSKQPPLLCRCTEYPIWRDHDRHGLAMQSLKTDRAKQMGKQLGIADVAQDARCVNCHGVFPADNSRINKATFRADEGVTCCVCHGEYEEWVDLHGSRLKADQWRALSRKEKEEVYGMKDLWDPVRRGRLCFSCHVGNTEESKFVTHAMYAAGHPPLPGIELATFSEQMPRHWETWPEKSKRLESLHSSLKDRFGIAPDQIGFQQSQLVLIGGAASLRASLELAVSQAEKAGDQGELDLALFDCYACHHELKNPSWRARRGYEGKPGRPQLQMAGDVLVRAGLASLKRPESELTAALKPLREAFDSRPFGNPPMVAARGKESLQWLSGLIDQLRATKGDRSRTDLVLNYLAEVKPKELPDYDSARIRAWAFLTLYAESRGLPYDDVKKQAEAIDTLLALTISAAHREPLEKNLPRSLARRNEFDPEAFRKEFRTFTQSLLKR